MAEAWKHWQGQTVNGEFLLGEYMGGSQNGAVFQTQFGDPNPQPAAIKLISENSSNAKNRLASWQSASTFSHPNLIKIFQAGHCRIGDAKLLYVVMEYAEENLSQILPHRPLTENEAAEMLSPVLGALAYLHAKGLVHGRIKPANIMASGDQLKLSSDGIRRAGDPISEPSGYDPPEATSSSAGDVWSLGMALVEVLTQRLPASDRHAQGDPTVPKTLPAPLLDIARHCLRPRSRAPMVARRHRQASQSSPGRTAHGKICPAKRRAEKHLVLIAALIVLLASIGLVGRRLLRESPRSDAPIPQATEKISKKSHPSPGQSQAQPLRKRSRSRPLQAQPQQKRNPNRRSRSQPPTRLHKSPCQLRPRRRQKFPKPKPPAAAEFTKFCPTCRRSPWIRSAAQ